MESLRRWSGVGKIPAVVRRVGHLAIRARQEPQLGHGAMCSLEGPSESAVVLCLHDRRRAFHDRRWRDLVAGSGEVRSRLPEGSPCRQSRQNGWVGTGSAQSLWSLRRGLHAGFRLRHPLAPVLAVRSKVAFARTSPPTASAVG